MNLRKKTSFCFQRFYKRFLSNKHRYFMSNGIQSWPKFVYNGKVLRSAQDQISTAIIMFIQYSLDENISAEAFPFFPKIFFVKDCIEQNTCFVAAVNFQWEINSLNMTALHVRCAFCCVRNRFQPQTRLWNHEQAMLIKIVVAFRSLLISSFACCYNTSKEGFYLF